MVPGQRVCVCVYTNISPLTLLLVQRWPNMAEPPHNYRGKSQLAHKKFSDVTASHQELRTQQKTS